MASALLVAALFAGAPTWARAASEGDVGTDATRPLPAFEEVLAQALSQSLDAKRAALQRDAAVYDRDLVGAGAWPSLGLSAAWGRREPPPATMAGSRALVHTYEARLAYDLLDFGRLSARREKAAQDLKAAELSIAEVNEALTWEVAGAYHALAAAARLLDITRENVAVAKAKLATIRNNYRTGLRPEADLLAAEGDFGNARLNYERARGEVVAAESALALLTRASEVGLGSSAQDQVLVTAAGAVVRDAARWREIVAKWPKGRQSSAAARRAAEREALTAEASLVSASQRPTLSAALTAQSSGPREDLQESYSGQLELSWDVPWSGQSAAQRAEIGARRQILELDETIEDRTRADVEALAMERFENAARLWDVVAAQVATRTKQYRLVRERYGIGKASALELGTAELDLGNARLEQTRTANALAAAVLDVAEARRLADPGVVFQK
jgi:outer membrane protein TolC